LVEPKPPEVLVFDMDGVLVEVGQSYREAIVQTVHHFTGEMVSHDLIQDFKNVGGWNNDWLLSQRLIQDRGVSIEYADVVEYFNRIFLGENGNGLILREQWIPKDRLLMRLSNQASLAIFTGRARYEADATLERCAPEIHFDPIVTDESVPNPKPAPDGLEVIKQLFPGKSIWYLGDTVDDARSSRGAAIPFVGISMLANPRHAEITKTLYAEGAFTVLENVNELESLIRKYSPR
jgi:HAD superfamily hydrolase (TIGR01548 family)